MCIRDSRSRDCLARGAAGGQAGYLHFLTDIALAHGQRGDHHGEAQVLGHAHQSHSPSISGWRSGSVSGHSRGHGAAAGCEAVTSGLQLGLSWGGKRERAACGSRHPRTNLAALVAAVSTPGALHIYSVPNVLATCCPVGGRAV